MSKLKEVDFLINFNPDDNSISYHFKSYQLRQNSRNRIVLKEKHFNVENIDFSSEEQTINVGKKILRRLREFSQEYGKNLDSIRVREGSLEHNILRLDPNLSQLIGFIGQVRANQAKPRPKEEAKKQGTIKPYSPTPHHSLIDEPTTYINVNVVNNLAFKTHAISMRGYDTKRDFARKQSPIFEYVSQDQNHKICSLDNYVCDLIMPHLAYAKKKGKKVLLKYRSDEKSFMHVLQNRIKARKFKHVTLSEISKSNTRNNDERRVNNESITDFIKDKYKRIVEFDSSEIVVFTDGSYAKGQIGAGFLIKRKGERDITGSKSIAENKLYRNSNGAELLSLITSLEKLRYMGVQDTTVHYVFDSDYIFKNLETISKGGKINNNVRPLFDRALDLIKEMNIEVESTVIKSHTLKQAAIDKYHSQIIEDNDLVDAISKRAINNVTSQNHSHSRN